MIYVKFLIVQNNLYIDGLEEIKRLNRKPKSYKITKEQVKYAIQRLKENEQITMEELHKIVKKKYKDFNITLMPFFYNPLILVSLIHIISSN